MRSNSWYLKYKGQRCPSCGQRNITPGEIQSDGLNAWCEVCCNDCQSSWQDVYKLTGFTHFEQGPVCEHSVDRSERACPECERWEAADHFFDLERDER